MSRANESAFPIQASDLTGSLDPQHGLTVREEFAKAAMQGLQAQFTSNDSYNIHTLASDAVAQADALIAALAKPVKP